MNRLGFIDNLRVFLTVLVILHHVGQAYGPTGGEWPVFEPERVAVLGPFFSVNAAFFMGLFFLLGGYFTPGSLERKGAREFLKDRIVRLGIPLALTAYGLVLPLAYSLSPGTPLPEFLERYLLRPETAHMWFVGVLLGFNLVAVAGWWWQRGQGGNASRVAGPPVPGDGLVIGYILLLALVSAVVRNWYPIDRWVHPLPLLRLEPAHLPQYASLFALGWLAARGNWLETFPTTRGWRWLGLGVVAALLRYAWGLGLLPGPEAVPGWGAPLAAIWESVLCVSLCLGLIVLFRENFSCQRALLRAMARGAFAAYFVHLYPVIVLQKAFQGLAWTSLNKFLVVSLLSVPVSFLLAHLLIRIPGLRRIL